ncbi:TrbI/VirB10 family protein [Acidithiobacillus sp. CV18-2]|nr:TrbI/VirB10 family protein [Acidithiobacillus sp. CV18-3]MBU2756008.1 TrbI/VirB10 family protein [Acidithiobacillus sp. BN09-2]MBU2777243.1 TrbI/VirB10 family protein [Acidithiobacillus sp. CV18-2]MBU2799907.1 TrbI/VirB10 family protein [Acidithiobacillus sp. VAN18-4]
MADNQTPMGEGKGKIRGSLLPDKKALGAHLKSGKIVAYSVAGAAVVATGGLGAIYLLHGFGSTPLPAKETVHKAPVFYAKSPQVPIKVPVARTSSGSTSTQSEAAGGGAAPQTGQTTEAQQPSPQVAAFEQAIQGRGGTGEAGSGWGSGVSTAAAASAKQSPNMLTLTKSIAEMTNKDKHHGVYSTHLVRREVSPYELLQGAVIPAILETGIKSDIAGQVKAVVTHPVYNSLNASYVLIPAGSVLVGTYKSGAAMGQTRVGVMWTRIEFPNGTYVQLGKMVGASPRGYAGFKDLVNNHTWEIFKNALLLSFIDVGMAVASPTTTTSTNSGVTGNEALVDGEQSLAQTFGEAEAQLFQKYINVSPTLTIRSGYVFNVVVSRDLVFPGPYRHGVNLVSTAAQAAPAKPSELDPYMGGRSE